MSAIIITTLFSLGIIVFLIIGGVVSAKSFTTEQTFLSVNQTNWLRSIAILMIMFSHYYPVLGLTYSDGIISFCMNFGYMGVAIFFFLSGYSVMISKINKPNYLNGFIKKRLIRLYIPFLIVFVINILILWFTGKEISAEYFIYMPLMSLPNTLNWYLKIQLCLYIVFYVLAKLIRNRNLLIGIVFAVCVVYMCIGYFSGITAFWYETVFAFPLGMFSANHKNTIFRLLSKRYLLTMVISVLVFILCTTPYYFRGGTVFEILFIAGFLQLIICSLVKFGGSTNNRLFSGLGIVSLELYFTHGIILTYVISAINISQYNLWINALCLVAFLAVSIVSAICLKKVEDVIIKRIILFK